MNKRAKTKVVVAGILIVFSLLFFGFVLADIQQLSDSKIYDDKTQTVTIQDESEKNIATIRLITPLNNVVPRGYQRIAEYEVTSLEALKIVVSKIDLYNKKGSMSSISRNIDYKIEGTEQVEVDDYEMNCTEVWNETAQNNSISCIRELIGSHFEDRMAWINLTKVDFTKDEKIVVGLFTDVQKGDYIEWIPTFEVAGKNYRIEEWATWTESMNVDLVSYYTMDDSSGGIIDSLGLNNGTENGNPTYSQTGKVGTSILFDGTDDSFEMTDSASLQACGTNNSMTIAMWINGTSSANAVVKLFSRWDGNAGNSQFLFIYIDSTDDMKWVWSNDSLAEERHFTMGHAEVMNDTWVHLAFVSNSDNLHSLYVNGVNWTTINDAGVLSPQLSTDSTLTWRLARGHDADDCFTGYIDEVGICSRALSPSEISDLYNDGSGMTYVGVFNTAPTITANATAPSTVHTNTNWLINLTITDADDGDTLTGYITFYVNDSLISTESNTATNNTNTLIGTLLSGNFSKTNSLTAEIWAGDGTENTTKTNLTLVTVSNSNPVITTLQTTVTQYTNGTYTFDYNVTDADSDTITWYDNTSLFNIDSSTGIISDTPTEDEEGTYSILITAGDGTANNTDVFAYTITDATPPTLSIIYPTATNYSTDRTTLNYSISDENIDDCWYSINQGTNISMNCSDNVTGITSLEGTNNWTIYANDTLGNENQTTVTFIIDSIAPSIAVSIVEGSVLIKERGGDATQINFTYNITETNWEYANYSFLYPNSSVFVENTSSTQNKVISLDMVQLGEGWKWILWSNDTFSNYQRRELTFDLLLREGGGASVSVTEDIIEEGVFVAPKDSFETFIDDSIQFFKRNPYAMIIILVITVILAGKKGTVILNQKRRR